MTQEKILEIIRKIIEEQVIDALCKEGFIVDEEKVYGIEPAIEQDYEKGLELLAKSYFDVQK